MDGPRRRFLSLLRFLRPGILQRNRSIEHQATRGRILVQGEIGQAFELIAQVRARLRQRRFALRRDHLETSRVEREAKIASVLL